jgi:DNA-binding transcriptional ArsR family regulator
MVKYSDDQLDAVFAALADRTRRGILQSLEGGSQGVSELAAPHGMSLPGFIKHLRVLEDAGLIARSKEGRVVNCQLEPEPMLGAAQWLAHYEKFWTGQLDALGRYLYQEQELNPWTKLPLPKNPPSPSSGSTPPPRKRSGARGRTRKP